jgi:hypothetical protein
MKRRIKKSSRLQVEKEPIGVVTLLQSYDSINCKLTEESLKKIKN